VSLSRPPTEQVDSPGNEANSDDFTSGELSLTSPTLDNVRRRSASRAKNVFTGSWRSPPTGSGNSSRQLGHVTFLAPRDGDVVVSRTLKSPRQRRQNVCRQDNILGSVYVSPHSGQFVNLLSPSSSLLPFTFTVSPLNGSLLSRSLSVAVSPFIVK